MFKSRITVNAIANYGGTSWSSLMSLVFVPLYIHFMGIESYGLIGIFGSLQALFGILDLGLSATMTREMARLSAKEDSWPEARDMARTLETVYWAMAILVGAATLLLAGPITNYWITPDRLPKEAVKQALMIMAFVIALRWPVSFYQGGLIGLQRQVPVNVISALVATLRGGGAVGVLWLVSPTIQTFFTFQIFCSAIEVVAEAIFLRRFLPPSGRRPRFRVDSLKQIWRFSASMTGISILVVILMHTDKVILSKMLTLEQFGYYILAWSIVLVMTRAIGPVCVAVYPRLTELATMNDKAAFASLYHKTSQVVTVITVPLASAVGLFPHEMLFLWSQNELLATNTAPILCILAIGTILNMIVNPPYYAQLAYGWVSLILVQCIVSVIMLIPLLIVLTLQYGPLGAATVWVILNGGTVLIAVNFMHRRIMPGEKRGWYLYDVALPTLTAMAIALAAKALMPANLSRIEVAAYLFAVGCLTLTAAALAAPTIRPLVIERLRSALRRCVRLGGGDRRDAGRAMRCEKIP